MAYKNPKQREARVITLIKEIACKVCELESSYMKIVLIKRYAKDSEGNRTDTLTCDAWTQHQDSTPQREVVWRGKNAQEVTTKDQPFTIFSRRQPDLKDGGIVHFMISDTKYDERHELAIIFDSELKISGVRKGDLMGNDFYQRVSKQCRELGDLLAFDKLITETYHYGD